MQNLTVDSELGTVRKYTLTKYSIIQVLNYFLCSSDRLSLEMELEYSNKSFDQHTDEGGEQSPWL